MMSSEMGFLPVFSTKIACGYRILRILCLKYFSKTYILMTLMLPPVDPPHAPMNIRPNKMILDKWLQASKLAVVNPEVVMKEIA